MGESIGAGVRRDGLRRRLRRGFASLLSAAAAGPVGSDMGLNGSVATVTDRGSPSVGNANAAAIPASASTARPTFPHRTRYSAGWSGGPPGACELVPMTL